ncbi:MAG: ABC transporter ATP-binding protein [Pseudomonadota bacterium]
MLKMMNIARTYQTKTLKTYALKDFSLDVESGEFVAVTGPSGSGKSTFLNIAGLLDNFNEGEYWLDEEKMQGLSDDTLSSIRNQKLGFIFQSYNLIPDFTLFENIEMPLRYRKMTRKERTIRIESSLDKVGLLGRSNYLPAELSGGQQQRVAIARALAGTPKVLLADEPTGNLDSLMSRQIMEILHQLNDDGMTIIMVTHNPEQAREVKRQIQIVDGKIMDYGVYSPLKKQATV